MPARKLQQTRRGRNRLDLRIRVEYRTRGGARSTRELVLYRIRRQRRGGLVFDAFDVRARAELTFDARRVHRLVEATTRRTWDSPQRIHDLLYRLHEVQELTPGLFRLPVRPADRLSRAAGTARWLN